LLLFTKLIIFFFQTVSGVICWKYSFENGSDAITVVTSGPPDLQFLQKVHVQFLYFSIQNFSKRRSHVISTGQVILNLSTENNNNIIGDLFESLKKNKLASF
jgi:hypothetical protein